MSSDPVDPQTPKYLIEGRGIKADLLLVPRDGRLVVVKDYGKRGWLGLVYCHLASFGNWVSLAERMEDG